MFRNKIPETMKPGRLCNGGIKPSAHDYKQVVWMDNLPSAFNPAMQVCPSTIRLADESSTVGRTQQNQDPAYKDTPDKGAALVLPIL